MTTLSDKIKAGLREAYGLGTTLKEYGGDRVLDYERLNDINEKIFEAFNDEIKELLTYKRPE